MLKLPMEKYIIPPNGRVVLLFRASKLPKYVYG